MHYLISHEQYENNSSDDSFRNINFNKESTWILRSILLEIFAVVCYKVIIQDCFSKWLGIE